MGHLKRDLEDDYVEPSVLYLYTTALHWALTQFTPASMEVTPRNWAERIYAILVVLFGLLVFSSTVSRITTSMSRLQELAAKDIHKVEQLHKYMTQQRTTLELNGCILSYLKYHRKQQQQRLHLVDVDYLNILPESLRGELCVEVFAPALMTHPLFEAVACVDEPHVALLCKSALSEKFINRDHHLFLHGDSASHMWYVTQGTLKYDPGNNRKGRHLKRSTFISEISLWVDWTFECSVSAKSSSELLAVESTSFHEIMRNCRCHNELKSYAQKFVSQMRTLIGTNWEVEFETADCREVVGQIFQDFDRIQAIDQHSSIYRGISKLQSAFKRWLSVDSDESDP